MSEIIKETLIDAIKILPFLFFTYLLMEYMEHKTSNKVKEAIKKSDKVGPLIGGTLGCVPQCGISVSASNLYAARVISLGTLIAIFLSTSDEMIPIAIASGASAIVIAKIIVIKLVISIIAGFSIDYLLRTKDKKQEEKIHDMCENEHCDCENRNNKIKYQTYNQYIYICYTNKLCIKSIGRFN